MKTLLIECCEISFKKEVKINLATFMVAGYDTTSTGLSYSLYMLVKHPEERVKLQDEIDAKFDRNTLVVTSQQDFCFMR